VYVPVVAGVTDKLPLVALAPVQDPEAVQLVALLADQLIVAEAPCLIEVGDTAMVTVGVGWLTVTETDLFTVPPAPVQLMVYVTVPVAAGVTDWLPLMALLPDQPPEAVQLVTLVVAHDSVVALPSVTVLGEALKLSVGAGVETVTVVEPVPVPPGPVQVSV